MANGIRALHKIQLGREVTPGTAVAGSTIWRGEGSIEDKSEIMSPNENIGLMINPDRTYKPFELASLEMDETEATFEQILHLFEAGIKTVAPVADVGAGASGYISAYPFPTTAQNTPKTYSIQGGDNVRVDLVDYALLEKITIAGVSKEAIKMGGTWFGRRVADGEFTGAVAIPTVEEILFQNTKLYINDVTSAYGTTLKSNTLLDFKIEIKTGFTPIFAGDGQLYFSLHKQVSPEINLEITFEHDTIAESEIGKYRTETSRAIRLITTGSALGTPGAEATKKLMIDLPGKWLSFSPLEERDGNDIVTGKFAVRYNSTLANAGLITVVHELSAIP